MPFDPDALDTRPPRPRKRSWVWEEPAAMPEGDIRPCVDCGAKPIGWEHHKVDPMGFSIACGICFSGMKTSRVATGSDKRDALGQWRQINTYRWPPKDEQ